MELQVTDSTPRNLPQRSHLKKESHLSDHLIHSHPKHLAQRKARSGGPRLSPLDTCIRCKFSLYEYIGQTFAQHHTGRFTVPTVSLASKYEHLQCRVLTRQGLMKFCLCVTITPKRQRILDSRTGFARASITVWMSDKY